MSPAETTPLAYPPPASGARCPHPHSHHTPGRPLHLALILIATALLSGCAALVAPYVKLSEMSPEEYIALKRGDILTQGKLSAATRESIRVAGLAEGPCAHPSPACITAVRDIAGANQERKLSALSELWLSHAQTLPEGDARLAAWQESARHAYAYLLFVDRGPDERAFEDRQTQVRDWYNHAVQESVRSLFSRQAGPAPFSYGDTIDAAGWSIRVEAPGLRNAHRRRHLRELVPASALAFRGLHSVYRRDGLGAELVVVLSPDDPQPSAGKLTDEPQAPQPAWSEITSPSATVLQHFEGDDLDAVLRTRQARLTVHNPYAENSVSIHGHSVPLAANFTAGYGLWLARSGFAGQSLRTLFGREQGIEQPHVYLLQPYDPDKRVIVMLHGLASSPEAWVNLANEVLGDEKLRRHFQLWLVYYPTNLPVALNHITVRNALRQTLTHFDPEGRSQASRDLIVIGHSMGGIISRLLVSSADGQFPEAVIPGESPGADAATLRQRLTPLLRFEPFPGIERVIFIATPHRGSPVAAQRLGRWISNMIRLPVTVMEGFSKILKDATEGDAAGKSSAHPQQHMQIRNSIENLDENDPFMRAAAELPIAPGLPYHSIIARSHPDGPLHESDDGLVPYPSAHLQGALTEKVIVSGHSVQQTPAAIIEIRRILHADLSQAPR